MQSLEHSFINWEIFSALCWYSVEDERNPALLYADEGFIFLIENKSEMSVYHTLLMRIFCKEKGMRQRFL